MDRAERERANKHSDKGKGETIQGELVKGETDKGEKGKGETIQGELGRAETGKGETRKGEKGRPHWPVVFEAPVNLPDTARTTGLSARRESTDRQTAQSTDREHRQTFGRRAGDPRTLGRLRVCRGVAGMISSSAQI